MSVGKYIVSVDIIKDRERSHLRPIIDAKYAKYHFQEAIVTDISPFIERLMTVEMGELKIGRIVINNNIHHDLWYYISTDVITLSRVKNGIRKSFHDNGTIKEEEELIDGIRHGVVKMWHDNGNLQLEEHYENGIKNGPSKRWYTNGRKRFESNFINNVEHGIRKRWNENYQCQATRFEYGKPEIMVIKNKGK